MRRKKEVMLVPCPICGQPMPPQVTAMVEQMLGKKRRMPTRGRKVGSNGWAFESTAPALVSSQQSKPWEARPLVEAPQPLSEAPLAPGEKREAKTYRARSLDDVWPPLVWSLVSGGLVGIAGGLACMAFDWEWFVGVGIWFSATTIGWFVSSKDLLDDDKLLTTVQEMVRAPEPQAPIVQPQPVTLEIIDREGKAIARPTLLHPVSNVQGLAEYADALVRGTAMPSMDGGKETNGARSYGYTESEFELWRRESIRAHLLISKGKQQGFELTPRGRRAFERIARLELEEASFG